MKLLCRILGHDWMIVLGHNELLQPEYIWKCWRCKKLEVMKSTDTSRMKKYMRRKT